MKLNFFFVNWPLKLVWALIKQDNLWECSDQFTVKNMSWAKDVVCITVFAFISSISLYCVLNVFMEILNRNVPICNNNVVCATSKASDQPAHTAYVQSDQSFCWSLEHSISVKLN